MIKILQFGEGNFLRAFADAYFQALKNEGEEIEVNIVIPINFPVMIDKFNAQDNKYSVILRGAKDGRGVEDVYPIDVVKQVINPFVDADSYYALARDKELKIIVSNTTEAGICFSDKDSINDFDGITYPAKLTKFLYERFKAGLSGLHLMPCELIDNNADALSSCVEKYIDLWSLPEEFKSWNKTENFYCNTLVDRIVSGYPRDDETKKHLISLLGEDDGLMTVGEPFGLWVVEKKGEIDKYISEGVHNVEVVLTNDISYYKKRKVRVLNGSHTNLVPAGLWHGAVTVYDCINDASLSRHLLDTLDGEIVPFVSDDIASTKVFADSVLDRFGNPYLNHQLTSIALNSISKWKARLLPSFKDYYKTHGKIAPHMTVGFAYLMNLYKRLEKKDGKFYVQLPTREIEIIDDLPYLEYFANGGSVADFMRDVAVWSEDLTAYKGFLSAVESDLAAIDEGKSLL
ncbi:MAG: tagaturonate reductase [Clostridia bacterium]|nr:tagaturonate reductase [Clostridia bacterium]